MCSYLHVHSTYSLYDSAQTPEEIVLQVKKLGGKNVSLTDHGTLLGIEPFMDAGKKYGINTIPGVEAYTENKHHLILVAKNYDGYLSISKAMREANRHIDTNSKPTKLSYPIMTKDIIERFFRGNTNVIATTACIQGIVPYTLLENYRTQKRTKKIMNTIESNRVGADIYLKCKDNIERYKSEIKKINEELKTTHKYTLKPYITKIEDTKIKLSKAREYLINYPDDEKKAKEVSLLIDKLDEMTALHANGIKIDSIAEKKIAEINKLISQQKKDVKDNQKAYNAYIKNKDALSTVSQSNDSDLYNRAREELLYLKNIFPCLYVELQYHELEEEAVAMPAMVKLAKDLNIPLIASNDAHITENTENCIEARRIMRFNYFEKAESVSDSDRTLYIKTPDEIKDALLKIIDEKDACEAINNLSILNECKVVFPAEKHYPSIKTKVSFDEILNAEKEKRINLGTWNEIYEDRFNHEVEVIKSMGYVDYHMIVRTICSTARVLGKVPKHKLSSLIDKYGFENIEEYINENVSDSGVGVGAGRGSSAGSLVCNMLGITNIDPIKYGLLFERFLNPERLTMPDIDTDIKKSLRPFIIKFLKWMYGENAVCSIATETCMGAKSALKLVGRDRASQLYANDKNAIKEYNHKYTYPLSDIVPDEANITLSSCEDELKEYINSNKETKLLWERAKLVKGKLSSISVHPGGIIISDNDDVNEYVPLAWNDSKSVWCAQCDMIKAEEKGLLKIDVLGLNMLDIISDCIHLIQKHKGILLNINDVPFEADVFSSIYSKGNTNSVFQFESDGMKSMLRKFKPTSFEDIILLIAAYRPGPMQYLENIIEIKRGIKKPEYRTPLLEPILSNTYGAVIYQEQVMLIFQKLAGYSLGGADLVRRAMSKKKTDILESERKSFIYGDKNRNITGCLVNGISEETANEIFNELIDFAKYAFNKSHAAVYALVSYQTAYLKHHYPVEYLCAVFNNKEQKEYASVIADCNTYDIKLQPIDINNSYYDFTVENDNSIRYGFKGITGIGEANRELFDTVCHNRNDLIYNTINDFLERNLIEAGENKYKLFPSKQYKLLAEVGAFDVMGYKRENLLDIPEIEESNYEYIKEKIKNIQIEYGVPNIKYNIQKEMEHIGYILSYDPLSQYGEDKKYGCLSYDRIEAVDNVSIFGFVLSGERTLSKKGKEMIVLDVIGKTGMCKVYLMGSLISKYNLDELINNVYKIKGNGMSEHTLMANDLTLLPPYNQCFRMIIKDRKEYEKFKEIYKSDEVGYEVHVCTHFTEKKNKVTEVFPPLFQTVYINSEIFTNLRKHISIKEWNI